MEGEKDGGTKDGSEEDEPGLKEGPMGPEGSRAEFGTIFTNTGTFCVLKHIVDLLNVFIWKKLKYSGFCLKVQLIKAG